MATLRLVLRRRIPARVVLGLAAPPLQGPFRGRLLNPIRSLPEGAVRSGTGKRHQT